MGGATPARSRYDADLRRTVDRIGTLGLPRLAAAFEPEPTRADAVRALVQRLADLAADLADEPRRTVPRLGDQAVGDQLAVCGQDLAAAAAAASAAGDPDTARDPDAAGDPDADGAHDDDARDRMLLEAADLLLDLRRRL